MLATHLYMVFFFWYDDYDQDTRRSRALLSQEEGLKSRGMLRFEHDTNFLTRQPRLFTSRRYPSLGQATTVMLGLPPISPPEAHTLQDVY